MRQFSIGQLTQYFQANSDRHFTGELLVLSSSIQAGHTRKQYSWSLYFRLGRLVWASSNLHRFRRWRRAIALCAPHLDPDQILMSPPADAPLVEYRTMKDLVRHGQLQRNQAIAIVEQIVNEVIFDILQEGETCDAIADASEHLKVLEEPITILNSKQTLSKAYQQWQVWCNSELARYSPHLAPYISNPDDLQQRVPGKAYSMLTHLIDGRSTLADLSVAVKQPLLKLTQSLAPYFRKGLLQVRILPDLPPQSISNLVQTPAAVRPKVLCIDDSPSICRQLSTVLSLSGYDCVSVQDPLQAIPTLLEEKPDLIFLDLVMPIASGYEICSQIRRISVFKDTPVVILTGNDGLVDRVRAKVVGASDFLSKPVNPQKVLEVARRHCPKPPSDAQSTLRPTSPTTPGQSSSILHQTA